MKRIGIICPSEIAFRRFHPALKEAACFEYAGVAIASKEEFVGATDEILAKERSKAQTFVDNYGGKIYEGYRNLIESNDIDAVYLPLPPGLHYQWAKVALNVGKHILAPHILQSAGAGPIKSNDLFNVAIVTDTRIGLDWRIPFSSCDLILGAYYDINWMWSKDKLNNIEPNKTGVLNRFNQYLQHGIGVTLGVGF